MKNKQEGKIIQTVGLSDFRNAFEQYNRKEQFSYDALEALFNYLENYAQDTGEDVELDIIGLCCEYTEYFNLEELQKSYPDIDSIQDLENYTTVISIDDSESFIIQNY